ERSLEFQQRALASQRTLLGEADPATSRSRLYVAYTLLRLGRRVEAARLVEEGLRHDPRHVELRQMQQQVAGAPAPGFRAPPKRPRGRGKR
ncbi:MAG: tetratricopeptide repeat protein, partial [Myxococcales bacterium]|nr:tetratricopeptide repeat protein [Myxococcales bacterium]